MKKLILIISISLISLGIITNVLFLIFSLFGSFFCGKMFYMIYGSNGPIPSCVSIFNTDFVYMLLVGIIVLIVGIILIFFYKKYKK